MPPVLVAWDGVLPPLAALQASALHAELQLEDGGVRARSRRPTPCRSATTA